MNLSKNTQILVGITGSIAAYKSPDLIRRLRQQGCMVQAVMSEAADSFITPLTLQAVSGYPVGQHLLDCDIESGMGHIELARWAQKIVIAPATAHFIAKLAQGLADDLLTTLCLASEADIIIAPAMNQMMWNNQATQDNIAKLQCRGIQIAGPSEGEQACGEVGVGRMLEPEQIANLVLKSNASGTLLGLKVLITAGPTWEAIDPVRFLSNQSSGKMGYAVAQAAAEQGAQVTLVSGPVNLTTPTGVHRIDVMSALEMHHNVMKIANQADIFIAVAAVSDYRPTDKAGQKIKKTASYLTLNLIQNPDILAEVASLKHPPYTVGFAAETENTLKNACLKQQTKGIDLIAANYVGGKTAVYGSNSNHITLISTDDSVDLGHGSKTQLAQHLINQISDRYHAKN